MSKRFGFFQWLGTILLILGVAVLAYVFLVRPWHVRWGATNQEINVSLPGDLWIPTGAKVSTRAITIQAPVSEVWPWVAQLGQERGGFVSVQRARRNYWEGGKREGAG